jgi:hypothetical protein
LVEKGINQGGKQQKGSIISQGKRAALFRLINGIGNEQTCETTGGRDYDYLE